MGSNACDGEIDLLTFVQGQSDNISDMERRSQPYHSTYLCCYQTVPLIQIVLWVDELSDISRTARLASAPSIHCQYFENVLPARARERRIQLPSLNELSLLWPEQAVLRSVTTTAETSFRRNEQTKTSKASSATSSIQRHETALLLYRRSSDKDSFLSPLKWSQACCGQNNQYHIVGRTTETPSQRNKPKQTRSFLLRPMPREMRSPYSCIGD
jgi:hypothetical protein